MVSKHQGNQLLAVQSGYWAMHASDKKLKIWLKLLSQMRSNSEALLQTEAFARSFSFSDGFAVVRLVWRSFFNKAIKMKQM